MAKLRTSMDMAVDHSTRTVGRFLLCELVWPEKNSAHMALTVLSSAPWSGCHTASSTEEEEVPHCVYTMQQMRETRMEFWNTSTLFCVKPTWYTNHRFSSFTAPSHSSSVATEARNSGLNMDRGMAVS